MASDDWSKNASLNQVNLAAEEYNFFQLTRLLEGMSEDSGARLRVEFAGHNTQATRPNFVEGIQVESADSGTQVKILTNGFHLLGQQGPLPQVFSELLSRESQSGNLGATAFVDLFNNRILRALYEVKKRFNPMLFNGSAEDSHLFRLFEAVSGVSEGSVFESKMPATFQRFWRQHAYLIGNRRISYGLLKQILSDLIDAHVEILPATGSWRVLPSDSQARLDKSVRLDASRSLGGRYWSHANGISIRLAFTSLEDYDAFLPSGDMHAHTVALIAVLTDLCFDVQLELRLAKGVKRTARVRNGLRLGQSSWLKGDSQKAGDGANLALTKGRLSVALRGRPGW